MKCYLNKRKVNHALALRVTTALLGGYLFTMPVLAADVGVVTTYSYGGTAAGQVGTITGSRVEATVDAQGQVKIDSGINADAQSFSILDDNGQVRIFIRQRAADGKQSLVVDPEGNWKSVIASTDLTAEPNIHAVAYKGHYLFATGYDYGKLIVADSAKNYQQAHVYEVPDAVKNATAGYSASTAYHGEGLVGRGNELYALFTCNPQGGNDTYADSFVIHYTIAADGSLEYKDYTRVGKNTMDMEEYNNVLLTASSGGYQYGGQANADTALHYVRLDETGKPVAEKVTYKGAAALKGEYRSVTVTPDGFAYVFTGNYDNSWAGMNGAVYRTTVSNLLSSSPDNWQKIIDIDNVPGYAWGVDVESTPHRLWFVSGNKILVYLDGQTTPIEFNMTSSGLTSLGDANINGFDTIKTDVVTGAADNIVKAGNLADATANYTTKISGTGAADEMNAYYLGTETIANNLYNVFTFKKDAVIGLGTNQLGDKTTNVLAAVYGCNGRDLTINAESSSGAKDKTLTLNVTNNAGTPSGVYAGNGKNVTINAGTLNINTVAYKDGETVTNAIWNDTAQDKSSIITINADTNISMQGGQGGHAVAVTKTDRWGEKSTAADQKSAIIINGDLKIGDASTGAYGVGLNTKNVISRFNNAGLYTSVEKSAITVNGNVDMAIYGNGAATAAKDSSITIKGGSIKVPAGKNYGYYTLASYLGTINLNTGSDGTTPGTNAVKLDGDIFALSTGSINLGLTTADSYLNGIVDNGGTVTMWLQNGALWTNTANNTRYTQDNEDVGNNGFSRITKLTGGISVSNAGVIAQKAASRDLTIDNYSGYTTVLYNHDAATPTTILGGTVKIGNAASGSNITLRTDYDANMSTGTIQDNVLNALANKLYYNAYTTGERNLTGKVEIAEGLTAQSAAKYVGGVTFSQTNGQGSYASNTPQPPAEQVTTAFTTSLTGIKDTEYVNGGVLKDGAYAFTKDSTITVDDGDVTDGNIGYNKAVAGILGNGNDIIINGAGKSLSITASTADANNQAIGVYTNKKLNLTAGSLTTKSTSSGKTAAGIFVNNGGEAIINGNVNVSAKDSAAGNAYGVYIYNGGSKLTVNGDLTMKGSGEGDNAYGVSAAQKSGSGTPVYQAKGIYMYDESTGGEVTVSGKADIAVKGTGVDMYGSKNNKITIASGSIVTPESTEDKFNALSIAAGTFNMGMNNTATNASGGDAIIKGNIYLLKEGTVNLGLGSAASSLTGVVDNSDGGTVNLYLHDGAIWNNRNTSKTTTFTDSHISKLAGGTSAVKQGVIFQQDSNPITVDNYSGYTTILYSHDATTPTTIIGGDVKITSAATGSNITLRTDNTGLNTSSTLAADKNLVSATLNALANKHYYTAYTTGERNLTGKVEIAEGLTAQSASMKVGNITYKADNGQGQYEYTPAEDISDPQKKTEFASAITGDKTIDTEYVNSGVLKDNGKYVFTKDKTTITVEKNLIAGGPWLPQISSAVSGSSADKAVSIELTNKELVINTTTDTHTTGITAIGDGKVEINNAGKITINAESTGGGQTAALFVNGGGQLVIHNGGDGLAGKVLTVRADSTTKANGAVIKSMNGANGKRSSITIDGLVDVIADGDMTDGKGANEAISAVASDISVGGGTIKAVNGAAYAIRAYGEFVSTNTGTVHVNVSKDSNGNITGAGDKKTVIEGDFCTSGGMGTNGLINVGLGTSDSSWTGNYTTSGGNVNLYMKDGATWTGYNSGKNFALNMKDGATWKVTGDSTISSLTSGNRAVKALAANTGATSGTFGGVVDMTNDKAGNVTIDNYSGNTLFMYKHDTTTPTSILGGNTTIKHAEADSAITLRTDSSGIDLEDDTTINSVLDALAKKLCYTNYTTDERNLSGYVQIAEGLTSSSITKQTGNIVFDSTTGQGALDKTTITPGVDYPASQTTDSFTTAINSDWATDKEYKKAGVLKKDGSYNFSKDKTTITVGKNLIAGGPWLPQISSAVSGSSADKAVSIELTNKELVINTTTDTHTTGITAIGDGKVEINNAGKITINAESTGGGQTAALFVNGGGQLVIHNGGDGLAGKVLTVRADSTSKANGAVIKSMNGANGKRSSITIDGLVDVIADGDMTDGKGANEAISAVASDISVGGGTIKAVNGAAYAIRAYGEFVSTNTGTVNVNVSKDSNGNITGAGDKKTVIEGDFCTSGGMGTNGLINVGLGTSDSSWTGNYTTSGGNVNLYMKDGATWTGYNNGKNFALNMKDGATWKVTGDSTISSLTSGSRAVKALAANTGANSGTFGGVVDMTNDKAGNVTIDNYSGNTLFMYKHDTTTPTNFFGGNTTIKHAEENSSITLRTDRSGIDLSNDTVINSVLNALAAKLNYANYVSGENNLSGYAQIAEGLTASSVGRATGTINYSSTDGQAALKPGSVIKTGGSEVIYGSKETAMMRGAKSAMASSAMLWRSENADAMQRMGDLRLGSEEKGIWARYYNGKSEYNEQHTEFETTYKAYQLGFDRQIANDWTVGAAVSYNDGSSRYLLGGKGDNSATSLSLYGTWQGSHGHYLDLLLKGSSLRNDYTVYNDFEHKLAGDYKTWGTSVSAEYGRHIEAGNGVYFDPGVKLTLGRIQGKEYNAHSDFLDSHGLAKDMFVSQDGFNSVIGKLSIGIGQKTKSSNIFAKFALAHEFAGNFTTHYAAEGEPTGSTEIDFGDTWYEIQLGGSTKLSKNSYIYATYEKTFNADVTNKWRIDTGLRWTF
ncbi:hypothetical protein [Sporomusa ovata]|uniref:COG3468: Type V secretory pathway, adhesin AidA n=1 Tax=Sporomusa ovata TaxID=2378 RepID=A0A0U1L483_9FIRM|nr:hypothetical protein [Sporomusa ovata]CQR74496.1 COG3468: Type V secretory pathway, adhesin AidA [Sporomusa ovata]